jgi:hypothetical protein
MKAAIARLGDAMLGHLLPTARAGACIVGAGTPCKCGSPCGATWCSQYRVSCFGQCVNTHAHC